jgi:hypothetical protein
MAAAALPFLKIVGGVLAAKTAIDGLKEGNLGKAILGGVGAYFSFSGLAAGAAGTATSNVATKGAGAVANNMTSGAVGGSFLGAAAPEISAAMGNAAGSMPAAFGAQAGSLTGITPVNAGVQAGLGSGSALSGAAMGAVDAIAPTANALGAAGGLLSSPALGVASQTGMTMPEQAGILSQMGGNAPTVLGRVDPVVDSVVKNRINLGSLGDIKRWAEANPELAASAMQMGGQALAGYASAEQRARELQRILNERARERSSRGAVADVNYDLR